MKKVTRVFLAIELSGQQREEVIRFQSKISGYFDGIRWVKPEQLHLTIKFLGDIEDKDLEQVKIALNTSVEQIEQFQLGYAGCGVFPSPGKARVVWAGVDKGDNELIKLAKLIDRALLNFGFEPEKRGYRPHLTLGRLARPVPENNIRLFLDRERSFKTKTVQTTGVVIFSSHLTGKGAVHTPLYEALF